MVKLISNNIHDKTPLMPINTAEESEKKQSIQTVSKIAAMILWVFIYVGTTTGASALTLYIEQLSGIDSNLIKMASLVGINFITCVGFTTAWHVANKDFENIEDFHDKFEQTLV